MMTRLKQFGMRHPDHAAAALKRELVAMLIANLTESEAQVLILRAVLGYSNRETAAAYALSPTGVSRLYTQATRKSLEFLRCLGVNRMSDTEI